MRGQGPALQAPHIPRGTWGVLLEIKGIKGQDKIPSMPPLVLRGQNPGVWPCCPQSVPGALPGGRRREGKESLGKEREAERWSWAGGVIGILGADASPAAGQHSRPSPWHQAVHSSSTAGAQGPSRLPATPAVGTLACTSSNVCHSAAPPPVSREFLTCFASPVTLPANLTPAQSAPLCGAWEHRGAQNLTRASPRAGDRGMHPICLPKGLPSPILRCGWCLSRSKASYSLFVLVPTA